jgi:hypothetical protein
MNALPRVDVGASALAAAVTGLLLMAVNHFVLSFPLDPVQMASLPVLVITAIIGIVAYLVPQYKEYAATAAGIIAVLVQAYLSSRKGEAVDLALVSSAIAAAVQLAALFLVPRLQPLRSTANDGGRYRIVERQK